MPPRSRGHDACSPRPHHARPVPHSVRAAEDTLADVARTGRATEIDTATPPLIMRSTGRPGGTPTGHSTRPKADDDASVRRSIQRENEGAAILADKGYDVRQNPTRVVRKRQTQRMVVNLSDWNGDLDALRTQFRDWREQ